MANRLFQEAREFVENVINSERNEDYEKSVDIAKNALSSAFANSTDAEKLQLRELQEKLEKHIK